MSVSQTHRKSNPNKNEPLNSQLVAIYLFWFPLQ